MVMLFRGEDAVSKVRCVVGSLSPDRRGGETIRDTYSDLIMDDQGGVRYFEPAVLAATNAEEAEKQMKLWAAIPTPTAAFWKMSSRTRPMWPGNARWC